MNFDPTNVRSWMLGYLARLLEIDERDIDLGKSLGDFGLDSVDAVIMAGELEEHFGVEIDPNVVFEFDTLQEMLEAWERARRAE
jgi:acyl carrier protein